MAKFSPDEYRHEGNAVSLLNYHFVFIPKRRKKVLTGVIAERLQQIICDVCNETDIPHPPVSQSVISDF
uniref:transposase n=1 Tax=Sphaerospermopsis aphanizomenoides TaxID=459663 RepID=UPI00398AB250